MQCMSRHSACTSGGQGQRARAALAICRRSATPHASQGSGTAVSQEEAQENSLFSWARAGKSLLKKDAIPVVTLPNTERPPASTPSGVPIIHSSAYLNQTFQDRIGSTLSSQDSDGPSDRGSPGPLAMPSGTGTVMVRRRPRVPASLPDEELGRNAIERALRKVDVSLDELEANPLPVQRVVYDISRGPVGTATGQVVSAAAKLALEAAKRAAPVGKWALAEGVKLAGNLVKAAVVESMKAEGRRAAQQQVDKERSRRSSSPGPTGTGTMKISAKKQPQQARR